MVLKLTELLLVLLLTADSLLHFSVRHRGLASFDDLVFVDLSGLRAQRHSCSHDFGFVTLADSRVVGRNLPDYVLHLPCASARFAQVIRSLVCRFLLQWLTRHKTAVMQLVVLLGHRCLNVVREGIDRNSLETSIGLVDRVVGAGALFLLLGTSDLIQDVCIDVRGRWNLLLLGYLMRLGRRQVLGLILLCLVSPLLCKRRQSRLGSYACPVARSSVCPQNELS